MYKESSLIVAFGLRNARIRNDDVMASCPFAKELHTNGTDDYPSFGINMYTGAWHCFACGERGKNLRTLAYRMRILLPDDLMMQTLSVAPKQIVDTADAIPDYDLAQVKQYNVAEAFAELSPRGITFAALEKFHVGWDEGSIQFPCILPNGKLSGIVERNSKWDGRYGYKPYGVKRQYLLFGLLDVMDQCILTESMTDMLKFNSCGIPAVSTCGNMIFPKQAEILLTHVKELILAPQRDDAAAKWLADARKHFEGRTKIFGYIIPAEHKDVGEESVTHEMVKEWMGKIIHVY